MTSYFLFIISLLLCPSATQHNSLIGMPCSRAAEDRRYLLSYNGSAYCTEKDLGWMSLDQTENRKLKFLQPRLSLGVLNGNYNGAMGETGP